MLSCQSLSINPCNRAGRSDARRAPYDNWSPHPMQQPRSDSAADVSSDSSPPLPPVAPQATRRELLLAMSGVAATVVIVAFDSTIVSTSMPRVAQALNGMALYAWVGTGYFLASAITILIFGRLGDLFGRKPLMLTSVAIVALGSILSGLSQTMPQLIAFRVLQGLGGGMMIATTFAAPADLFPDPRQRVRWMALVSATFAAASGLGPVIGGLVTQALGWRAAFFITPLAAAVALVMLWRYFPRIRPRHAVKQKIDWLGAGLLTLAVGAPLAGIELLMAEGQEEFRFLAMGLIAAGLIAAGVLLPVERRATTPIFPLRILHTRQSQLLNLAAMMTGAVMVVLIFYLPLLLQEVFGYSPTRAGLLMTPLVAGIPLGSIINGQLFPRQNEPQRLMIFGSGMLGLGCLLTLTFVADSPTWWVLLSLGLSGAGLGFLLPNFTLFMQMLAEQRDVGVASALIQTTRALGSAIGTAIVGIVIARLSVSTGLRIGLVFSVVLCALVAWLASRIKMKNVVPR